MHVQTDFITNSSSTAYIVFVPNSFYVTDKHIEKAIQFYINNIDYDFTVDDAQLKEVAEVVEMMKGGEQYDSYGGEDLWNICFAIFSDEGFIVDGIECNEGNLTMKGFNQKTVMSTIINHVDLDDMVNTLIKGVNYEKQNKE